MSINIYGSGWKLNMFNSITISPLNPFLFQERVYGT